MSIDIYLNTTTIGHDTYIKVEGTYLYSKTNILESLSKNALQLSHSYLETLRNTCTQKRQI